MKMYRLVPSPARSKTNSKDEVSFFLSFRKIRRKEEPNEVRPLVQETVSIGFWHCGIVSISILARNLQFTV